MATYFSHKVTNRIHLRNPRVQYGPPAPYPHQRNPIGYADLRDVARPRPGNPKYLEYRGGYMDYQRFRPGVSLPGYNPAASGSESMQRFAAGRAGFFSARGAAAAFRLGLGAAGITPQGIALNIGMTLLDRMDFDSPWGYQIPEQPGAWEYPDGYVCASYRGSVAMDLCGPHVLTTPYSDMRPDCHTWHYNFQALASSPPQGGNFVRAGPKVGGIYGCERFNYDLVIKYPWGRNIRPDEVVYRSPRPQQALPLPRSIPPLPAWQETVQEPPNPREWLEPYQRPSIDIEVDGGRNGPVHPRNGVHDQLPPGPRVREKKEKIAASKLGAWIYKLYDQTTEASEIVDILYDNLGTKCKGAKGMAAKANCVYQNLSTLDVEQAIEDIIQNHYEDKLWGKFYGYGKRAPFGAQLPGGTMPRIEHLSQRS